MAKNTKQTVARDSPCALLASLGGRDLLGDSGSCYSDRPQVGL